MYPIELSLSEPTENPHFYTCRDNQGEAFSVRPYASRDFSTLVDFYAEFEPQRGAQGLPPTGRERIVRWLGAVLPRGIHLVAHRGDQLIGHSLVIPMERGVAEYAVFVDQTERGRGVGTELNRFAVKRAREGGFRRLWLSVEPRNRAAIRSYEKVGFRFKPATIYSSETELVLDLDPTDNGA